MSVEINIFCFGHLMSCNTWDTVYILDSKALLSYSLFLPGLVCMVLPKRPINRFQPVQQMLAKGGTYPQPPTKPKFSAV